MGHGSRKGRFTKHTGDTPPVLDGSFQDIDFDQTTCLNGKIGEKILKIQRDPPNPEIR
jgi:hypothetical protein